MTKRERIKSKMDAIKKKVSELELQYIEWSKQYLLLSDKKSWYKENNETHGKGKNKKTYLIGRVHWIETFTDESTGEKIDIERSKVVKQDGEWIVNLSF